MLRQLAITIFGYGFALAAGFAASKLNVPLAWVLGPMFAMAALAMSGFDVPASSNFRRAGQLVVGTGVGLSITAQVVPELVGWLPYIAMTMVVSITLAAVLSVPYAYLARIDQKTAFFAMLPGGMTEMANIAQQVGAQSAPIAVTQALRVAVIVLVMPALIVAFSSEVAVAVRVATREIDLGYLPVLLALSGLGVFAIKAIGLNNPWFLGALLSAALLTATGHFLTGIPSFIFAGAQYFIGIAIGVRFRREIMLELPRMAFWAVVFVISLNVVMMVYAYGLSWLRDASFENLILASGTGGAVELAITAQVLGLNVALVTAFHAIRAAAVNGFALHYWRGLERIGFFRRLTGVLGLAQGK
jgi:hypothetical protein